MFRRISHSLLAFVLLFGTISISWSQARADIDSCSASVTPHTIIPGATTDFNVVVTNTDTNPINLIRVTRPSTNFTILSNSAPGWQSTTSSRYAIQTNGTLAPSQSLTITITAQAASVEAGAANWTVQTSEEPGVNIFSCSGSLDTAISGYTPDTTPPVISNILVSSLGSDSATISWDTDEPATTQVNYGLTAGYGSSSPLDSNLTTNHSVVIAGLSQNTGYHFQARSSDGSDNVSLSSDNTFLTNSDGNSGGNTGGGSNNGSSSGGASSPARSKIPIKAVPTESIPPKISFNTSLKEPFKTTPIISGTVTDNEAVAGVEYSTDGGQNWLFVDKDDGIGSAQVSFEFKPLNLQDGNYDVLVRAIDTSGNVGYSPAEILVIDRLVPSVGGSVMSIGPQILNPDDKGVIYTLAGLDQKLTVSAVGGPTNMKVVAVPAEGGEKSLDSYTMTQSSDTGLWSGVISIKKPGFYRLKINSVDGANNKKSQDLGYIQVAPQPQLLTKGSDEPVNGSVEVFYLEPESGSWTLWDGGSYGQENPQQTDAVGNFKLFLPQGKYYLKAKANGYRGLTSDIFEIKSPQPVSATLYMSQSRLFGIGAIDLSMPMWSTGKVEENLQNSLPEDFAQNDLVGKALPDFSLASTDGKKTRTVDLLGKPTLISVMTTWSPGTSRQLEVLAELQANQDTNVLPVAVQERSGKVESFTIISGLEAKWLVDPEAKLSGLLGPQGVPTHYFVDRKGNIKKVIYDFIDESTAEALLRNI